MRLEKFKWKINLFKIRQWDDKLIRTENSEQLVEAFLTELRCIEKFSKKGKISLPSYRGLEVFLHEKFGPEEKKYKQTLS